MKFSTKGALESLSKIKDQLDGLPSLDIAKLNTEETVLIHVDIVEGFLNFGALHSKDAQGIVPFVEKLNEKMKDYKKIFVIDRHPKGAVEFKSYPPHCEEGSGEDELIEELLPYTEDSLIISKNSTNLFHAKDFLDFLKDFPQIKDFVFVGVVTDICILQATLSLRSYFNEHNQDKEIHVLVPAVDTFELEATNHPRGLHNLFSLYNMQMNGIKLYRDIL
ncbi:MAG: cysteine hydrolase [Tissierellia bacterium]|nr:cysteine hydrolase [Tissierellia bacterium]